MTHPEGAGPRYHETVLLKEVLDTLNPQPGQVIIDGTLGHGGHSLEILRRLRGEGLLVGLDRDPQMLATARDRIEAAHVPADSYRLVHADFADLKSVVAPVLAESDVAEPDAILLDLGPSNPQLLDPARGLSWESDQALDMRLDPTAPAPTAYDLVNDWPVGDLARLFREHADERWAKRIAERIGEARKQGPIRTGRELGELVAGAIPRKAWPPKIHPATRVFLALRIEVNGELERVDRVMPAAFEMLAPGGRMAIITFHSGEDRRVKRFMREMTTAPEAPWPLPQGNEPAAARDLTRKPQVAGDEEREANPRSRSAKLRAIEKRKGE